MRRICSRSPPALDPRLLVLSLRAPHVRGPDRYAWYGITFTPEGPVHVPEQAESSRQLLIQFIAEAVAAFGADGQRVYLIGFSQGAILSEAVALTAPERWRGRC